MASPRENIKGGRYNNNFIYLDRKHYFFLACSLAFNNVSTKHSVIFNLSLTFIGGSHSDKRKHSNIYVRNLLSALGLLNTKGTSIVRLVKKYSRQPINVLCNGSIKSCPKTFVFANTYINHSKLFL